MKKKLQVFISSTYKDLINERQAAVSAILKSGHIPAGMELFNANDRSQWQTIKEWIDESDVFVLILGGRYGSIDNDSGKSYTELEYNYALETNKRYFAIVISPQALNAKVSQNGIDFLERNYQRELNSFQDRVLSKISSYFDDEKDIFANIISSLREIEQDKKLIGWICGREVKDVLAITEECNNLQNENIYLKSEIENLKSPFNQENFIKKQFEFHSLLIDLQMINLSQPLGDGSGYNKYSLLTLFLNIADALVIGIVSNTEYNGVERFICFELCPKLSIYGLVTSVIERGARFPTFRLSEKGRAFAAYAYVNLPS